MWGSSVEECHKATLIVLQTLERRGFVVNFRKSRLPPAKLFEWLGIHWNTSEALLSLPEDKISSLYRDLRNFTSKTLVSRRQIEKPWKAPICLAGGPNQKSYAKVFNSLSSSHGQKRVEGQVVLHTVISQDVIEEMVEARNSFIINTISSSPSVYGYLF